jgi:hypothetical protein
VQRLQLGGHWAVLIQKRYPGGLYKVLGSGVVSSVCSFNLFEGIADRTCYWTWHGV